jgi:ribosome-associated heat shock protein Hsp15
MEREHVGGVRLDVWLDVACLFRTRSEAQRACRTGRVSVNGVPAKPHREVKPGDRLVLSRPLGRTQTVEVVAVTDRHLPKAEARALYHDHTPPPTPEEVERRQAERRFRALTTPAGRPDRRERRALRDRKRPW